MFTLMLCLLLLPAFLAGCGGQPAGEEAAGPTEEITAPEVTAEPDKAAAPPTPAPTPEPTPEMPVYRSPFTGEIVDEPVTVRPFTFNINNHPDAQPHHALNEAAIIYEAPTEGSVTRLQALFPDIRSVGFIGAVRSMRTFYLDTGLSYGAVICHAGGSDESYARIAGEHIENLDGVRATYGFAPFFRDPRRMLRGWEHAMFTTGQEVWDLAELQEYPLTLPEDYDCGLRFSEDGAAPDGEDAPELIAYFTNWKTTNLIYDPDTDRYFAWQEMMNSDIYDGNTGETVWFDNVLFLSVHTEHLDNMGHRTMYFTEGGPGVWACGGKAVSIQWRQDEDYGPFRYTTEDGSDVLLRPGRTYIALIPNKDAYIPGHYEVLSERASDYAPRTHEPEEIVVGQYSQ